MAEKHTAHGVTQSPSRVLQYALLPASPCALLKQSVAHLSIATTSGGDSTVCGISNLDVTHHHAQTADD